jgi:hypothetical protein
VSPLPDPQIDLAQLEETRKRINLLVAQIARDSESDMPPGDYYGQFLQRVLDAVAAPAGAVWIRTPQGHLQLQFHIKLNQVGLDRSETDRQTHDELLRMAAQQGRPQMVPPHSGTGPAEDGKVAPGNPTDYMILLAPILVDKQVAGLVEVWQDADRNPQAQEGFLRFITQMAGLASTYTRNHQLRQMVGQQALWTQLEAFARQIHGSLNPMEVGYHVANEGRRLVECDRVSVALRRGKKARIEAISGADVVEKRSNLVRLMASLFDKVLKWGEKLIYKGTQDDSLPPDVLKALDAYLAESNSKLLVVLPLKDERENESKKPPRSGVMMECFDPSSTPEQLIARLEVIGRHATSALYNASEYRRIPMRWVWMPLAKVQEGLGGKARAIALGIVAAVAALVAVMIFVPYPLKMDAKGQLLPVERRYVYSPKLASIVDFKVVPGQDVFKDDDLAEMFDAELAEKLIRLEGEEGASRKKLYAVQQQLIDAKPEEKSRYQSEALVEESTLRLKQREIAEIREQTHSIPNQGQEGHFMIRSPLIGTVLGSPLTPGSFRDELTGREIKPSEPILRVGNKKSRWEIELKIPQKHIGQVLQAFKTKDPDEELDVDLILRSTPTKTYRARLARRRIGGEATPNRDDNNESEPVVLAYGRIDGDDIPEAQRVPHDENYLVTGTEIVAKVRCGPRPMGYSLFYGVWEFFYEKVVFFF